MARRISWENEEGMEYKKYNQGTAQMYKQLKKLTLSLWDRCRQGIVHFGCPAEKLGHGHSLSFLSHLLFILCLSIACGLVSAMRYISVVDSMAMFMAGT